MDIEALDRTLRESVQDFKLDPAEKIELRELGKQLDAGRVRFLRNRAFEIARDVLLEKGTIHEPGEPLAALHWLEQVIKTLDAASDIAPVVSSAYFSPGENCLRQLGDLMRNCRASLDVCVFTIADDRLTDAILDCHARGVQVRVVSDNDKQYDSGSDIARLRGHGVPIRLDGTAAHMHHKFALFDRHVLANGSFNWTRSATRDNDENLVVTDDVNLVRLFGMQFEKLWKQFG
ncbi:MAG: phospholipase D-like domain-containing protein [Pseudomonadota bacterium]|nr:phospholipase D-like domain-containing protein [Pseudomonadota bacterium]MDQ3159867.1 phospholipase D-like domain-containing protein [Pseudomonadota bacterium]